MFNAIFVFNRPISTTPINLSLGSNYAATNKESSALVSYVLNTQPNPYNPVIEPDQ